MAIFNGNRDNVAYFLKFPWEITSAIFALLLIAFLSTLVVKSALADGRADFCYLQTHSNSTPAIGAKYPIEIEGHRPWRSDITIGYAETIEGAVEVAKQAQCPLFTEKP